MAEPKAPTLSDARRAADAIARARPDVALVMLYGSVARGEATEDSDIDLAVVLNDLGDYWDRRDIQFQFAHDCSVCAERAFARTAGGAWADLAKTVEDALARLRRDAPQLTGVEITE